MIVLRVEPEQHWRDLKRIIPQGWFMESPDGRKQGIPDELFEGENDVGCLCNLRTASNFWKAIDELT